MHARYIRSLAFECCNIALVIVSVYLPRVWAMPQHTLPNLCGLHYIEVHMTETGGREKWSEVLHLLDRRSPA